MRVAEFMIVRVVFLFVFGVFLDRSMEYIHQSPVFLIVGTSLFYFFAIFLMFKEDGRICATSVVWSGSIIAIVYVVLSYKTCAGHVPSNFWQLMFAYCGYCITPMTILFRFWNEPNLT